VRYKKGIASNIQFSLDIHIFNKLRVLGVDFANSYFKETPWLFRKCNSFNFKDYVHGLLVLCKFQSVSELTNVYIEHLKENPSSVDDLKFDFFISEEDFISITFSGKNIFKMLHHGLYDKIAMRKYIKLSASATRHSSEFSASEFYVTFFEMLEGLPDFTDNVICLISSLVHDVHKPIFRLLVQEVNIYYPEIHKKFFSHIEDDFYD
jgi:hypothetical protein